MSRRFPQFAIQTFQMFRRPASIIFAGCLLIVFLLVAASRGASAQTAVPTPAATPDAGRGLQTYEQRCATCHGPLGAGDGELAADLPAPPTALSDPDFLRSAVPSRLFEVITNGRPQNGMPPFGPASSNPLSEQARWDLIAAIYSLGTSSENLADGQALYEANCAACHGENGSDGATDFSAPGVWMDQSNAALFELLAAPIDEHTFTLSPDEKWAVVDYVRSFGYRYLDPARLSEPISTVTIQGNVTNGTTGETVTDGAAVLRIFEGGQLAETLTTTVGSDGHYQFDLVDVPPDQLFVVQVEHAGLNFNSSIGQITHTEPDLALPVRVFETTTDSGVIRIEQVHIILEFVEDRVRVNEFYQFSNEGSAVYVGAQGQPAAGTVSIVLPDGALNPLFQRSLGTVHDFLPADDLLNSGQRWLETTPVYPGQGTLALLARYELPYERGIAIAHPVDYDTGRINLILPEVGVTLENSERWEVSTAQQTAQGNFTNYSQAGVVGGETIEIPLTGRPRQVIGPEGAAVQVRDETTELLIGGGVLLATLGLATFFVTNWRQVQPANEAPEELLAALAELDDAYEAGEIARDVYETERALLKDRLIDLWER